MNRHPEWVRCVVAKSYVGLNVVMTFERVAGAVALMNGILSHDRPFSVPLDVDRFQEI